MRCLRMPAGLPPWLSLAARTLCALEDPRILLVRQGYTTWLFPWPWNLLLLPVPPTPPTLFSFQLSLSSRQTLTRALPHNFRLPPPHASTSPSPSPPPHPKPKITAISQCPPTSRFSANMQTFRMPVITTSDSAVSPSGLWTSPNPNRSVGTRYETVPHEGPGTAVYVPQPTRAELVRPFSPLCVLSEGAPSRCAALPPFAQEKMFTSAWSFLCFSQRAKSGLEGSPIRPFYVRDPEGRNFIDIDGKVVSPRWILYDPRGGEPDSKGCTCM